MKQLPYALFDMDGTLVDSMTYWMTAPGEYVRRVLPDITAEQEAALAETRTYVGLLEKLVSWGVRVTVDDIIHASEDLMMEHYRKDITTKPGAIPLLEELFHAGTKMGLITMTPHRAVDICLAKTGLDKYFSFVLTPEDTSDGSGKEKREIFDIGMARLGCEHPSDCLFFEDSVYAAKTAHDLGFYLVGVYDAWAENEAVRDISDDYLNLDGEVSHK